MKRKSSSRHSDSEENIIAALNQYLDVQDIDFYKAGIGAPWGQ